MNKMIICRFCRFMTSSAEDMVDHLACTHKYKQKNCTDKFLFFEEKEKVIKNDTN